MALNGFLMLGCATGKQYVARPPEPSVPLDAGIGRLFLVGDAGEDNAAFARNAQLLRQCIHRSEIPATVVFLGDNVYPRGVPNKEDSSGYRWALQTLEAQEQAVAGLAKQTIFIPGNHDWNKGKAGGLKRIRRQGKLVNKSGVAEMLPRKGCAGPEVVELTKDVVMIIIDSQWWLQDWRAEGDINGGCNVTSRADLLDAFAQLLKDYQEKQVIVAMHHPMVSAGSHGGYFTVKDHLFPLTNIHGLKYCYLPLPIIGSIYPLYRSAIGDVEDLVNHKYAALRSGLLDAARFYDNVMFVGGHEHTLEYDQIGSRPFLISGAGCKNTKIGKTKTLCYGHSVPGFMQLNLKEDGSIDLLIWESGTGTVDKPAYQVPLMPALTPSAGGSAEAVVPRFPDTIRVPISTQYAKGGFYRFLFGERYRDIYEIPVPAKVLNLSTAAGGLTPVKKGGGFQTNSLRLEDSLHKEYAARSMNKDATRLLPESLRHTFASDILQDQFTGSHPYAAFVIPALAEEAGIYHTNPELVYIPVQPGLGGYSEDFGNQLYLFEERPGKEWAGAKCFGGAKDIVGYDDVLDETMDDYRNQVDQTFVARSRLFDMFLGDWDRHDDQWRWAVFDRTDGKGKIYRPIPRDRDQAFSTYDGLLVSMGKWFTPGVRKLCKFNGDIRNVRWFNDNGKVFDRDFLNALTKDQWIAIATDLQKSITDKGIEQSIRSWPPEVFAQGGEHIISTLKARRDNLPEIAARYYDVLAGTVYIRGTRQADYIEITENRGSVRVRLYDSNKEGDKHELYYDRSFVKGVTRQIQIYGLDGHDHFEITGNGSGGIHVYCVGGDDKDSVTRVDGKRHGKIRLRDNQPRQAMISNTAVSYKKVGDEQNAYDRTAFLYDYSIPKVLIGGNPDDGLLVGGGVQWVKHGFEKSPYATKQSIDAFYAFATGSYGFDYAGEWADVIGKLNAGLTASYQGPTYVQNFFGFGNDAIELAGEKPDFYRVRMHGYAVLPYLRLGKDDGNSLLLRTGFQSREVEETSGRFVTSPMSHLPDDIFHEKHFIVVNGAYQYRVVDNSLYVQHGMDFQLSGGVDIGLDNQEDVHRYVKSSLALYYQLKHLGRPVVATRIGVEWHGGDFQFYQGAMLGGQNNFRGMRKERFVGNKLFYQNTDLRFVLGQWHSYYLPAAMGIQLNFDHGRVWLDHEDSDTWHYAYGGGIWISPFESAIFSINYHTSDIDRQFTAGLGFLF